VNISDYRVLSIKREECIPWLKYKHYAHRIPSISYAFGLYNIENILKGICTFGSPPSHALCIGVCGKQYQEYVLELNRLCIEDNIKNAASYFVSRCLKLIPKPRIIVSYADTSKNHHGYIYQATNFIYTGLSAKRTERYDIDNPNKHSKTVSANLKRGTENNKDYLSLAVRDRPQKHRYIYFIGNKKQKKKMKDNLLYPILPYPKGDNKKYDASYKPSVQSLLF